MKGHFGSILCASSPLVEEASSMFYVLRSESTCFPMCNVIVREGMRLGCIVKA